MKKIFLLLLLVLVSVTASARKSYITVYCDDIDGYSSTIYLTGDVPDDIEGFKYLSSSNRWSYQATIKYSTGDILNVLSEYGYEVEFVNSAPSHSSTGTGSPTISYLLSKEISSGQTVSEGDVNKDGEVNISDINRLVDMILGYVREHPELLEQIRK